MNKGLLGKVSFFSLLFILTIVFMIVLNASLIKAGGGGPKNPCNQTKFCFADAFNTDSNESIVICAGTLANVNWFNIWYNETQLNDTNGGILSKQYYTFNNGYDGVPGAPYNNGPLNKNTDPFCVLFVLNGDNASFTNKTIQINGTAYNKTNYVTECDPGGCNGTMFTINYVSIETKNAAGSAFLPNVPIMAFDNSTKSFIMNGPALTDSNGYWAEHCIGIVNQSSGACINATSLPGDFPNSCWIHGISFPLETEGPQCVLNQTTTIYGIDFLSSNMTQQNVAPGTPLIMNLGTSASMSMIMASVWNPDSGGQMNNIPAQIRVYDNTTNELLFITSGGGGQGGGSPPAFLQPYRHYKINFDYGGRNYSFPFMTPVAGMTGAQIFLANSTSFNPDTDYRTVIGKVVNETKDANGNNYPIANATVYVQFYKGPSGAFGIQFFNSSFTDQYGMFSMRIPMSRAPSGNQQGYFPTYQFYIVSDKTNNGVPLYFTTIDNNGNRGYFAIGDTVVLPPLVLRAGGQVDVNVALNNASTVISELNKFLSLGTGMSRDAVTGKFTMTSIFETVLPPASLNMSLLSPVGSNLVVDLFGKNSSMGDPMSGSITSACFNTSATVTQGNKAYIKCNLTQPGYLNLIVFSCNDIFDVNLSDEAKCANIYSGMNRDKWTGSFNFWFEANGILRTGNQILSFISPEGVLLDNLIGYGNDAPILRMPLPPGNYTLELVSPFDYGRYLNVYNKTNFTIVAGATTILNLTRGNSWNIQPMFNPSMSLSENNQLNVSVMTQQGLPLNNTSVTLTGKILFLNKSNANSTIITFDFDESRKTFYNTTFKPSDYNLNAGKYLIFLNVSNVSNNVLYSTTSSMPINAFDFQVGIDLGGFTFGTGQTISGRIFAYNTSGTQQNPVGLNASSGNVTIKVYDETGADVTSVSANVSNITNGQGYVNLTMPSSLGFYEIVTSIRTNGCVASGCTDNAVGVSDNWVQISNLNIKMTTDKQNYQSNDNVVLTVQVSNSTNGSAIQGASIEVVADSSSTPAMATTGSDGKAAITLNASTHSGSTSWSNGWHNLKVKISKRTDTDVIKLDSWYGFDVRGFDLFLRPDKPSYGTTDNVTITAYGQTQGISISGVKVDGTTLAGGGNNICPPIPNVTFCTDAAFGGDTSSNIRIGNWSVGHHNVEITVSSGGGQQKFYTGFDVSNYNIIATTDRFSYDLNQNITLNIKASYINGTVLSNQNVTATLYKAQPPNDIYVTQNNGTTDSSGQATIKLNATQPGFNYIKINMNGQLQFIGVQVSSLKVNLLDSSRNIVTNYDASAGSSVTIYINATSGGNNVPNGSTVSAKLWSFGNFIDLPTNTTTNGNATITFSISPSAPAQMYGLEVRITTTNGEQGFAQPSTLTVTGGSALQLAISADRSFSNPYKIGDTAILSASLTYSNGTAVEGYNVTFEVGSEGSRSQTIGTAVTGSGGTATKTFAISNNYTDGPYFVHAYLTDNTDVQAYSGFMISSLKVDVITNKNSYSPGENITLNLTVTNRTSGSQVNVTSMFVILFNKNKGEINNYFTPSGAQPYQLNVSISNESGSIGTYPMAIVAFVNQSQGVGFTMVDFKNASQSLNLSLPPTISAGSYFLANISSSLNGTATLRIFSPTASNVVYENTSISLSTSGTPNATVNMTISNPGVYVFNAFVSGIGTTTQIVTVSSPLSGTIPAVWTGTGLTSNSTAFSTSNNVYVMSNLANSTATILTMEESTNTTITNSLPLTLNSGSTYYGIFNSTNLVSGRKYFVRLDTSTSTGIINTMFMVS